MPRLEPQIIVVLATLVLLLGTLCWHLNCALNALREHTATQATIERTVCDGRVAIWREDSEWWAHYALLR